MEAAGCCAACLLKYTALNLTQHSCKNSDILLCWLQLKCVSLEFYVLQVILVLWDVCIIGCVVADVSKDCSTFMCRVSHFAWTT